MACRRGSVKRRSSPCGGSENTHCMNHHKAGTTATESATRKSIWPPIARGEACHVSVTFRRRHSTSGWLSAQCQFTVFRDRLLMYVRNVLLLLGGRSFSYQAKQCRS